MKPTTDWRLLWRCFLYLAPFKAVLIGIYGSMVLINLVQLIIPLLLRWGIDEGIYGNDLGLLARAVGFIMLATLVKGVLVYYQGVWSESSSQSVAYFLRGELLAALGRLSFSFHDEMEAGQILSRAMQDVERIRFLTGRAILRLIEGALLILSIAVVLLVMNSTLALLILLTVPFLVHRAYIFGRQIRPLSVDIQQQLGVLTTTLEQNLRGARVVKSFAQEEKEIAQFAEQNEQWYEIAEKTARVQALNAPLLDVIANFGTVFIFWYGGWLVTQDQLTLGELVAFTTYLAQLVRPIRLIGRIIPILAIAASAGERIFSILDQQPTVRSRPDASQLPAIRGEVRFENVAFAYPDSREVLEDIDFTAAPGQIIALMGATGSGKTTLVHMLARFHDPTRGRVTIDGMDLQEITLDSLRQQIGFVMQDSVLFAATVRENITFGRPDASEAEIIQAAKDAQAYEFISQMPNGFDTYVGEQGVTLSGGQKQRLAIARTLITNPRILVLDDATSSVDTRTEQLIQKALDRLMEGRTTFIIAHRLSTVQRADRILLLERGRMVAFGTHAEILASSPLYQQIEALQVQRATQGDEHEL
ncbi:MAG: ABC transporter ATP-binding protein [Ardenticatenales bacterium]|nr:ABC transporter ATP-binding protein [Ardenticatenales bacterium]